ncbi:hypothetical protein DFH28DRAFT_1082960 [Melampsora americana]|nr:hypothetical protein DFH28DRAFT_1082960 [Melampsora americana]
MSKPNELHEDTMFQADSDIQRIVSELPPILRDIPENISPEEKAQLPPYVNRLRHFLKISCAHKRLVIHRSFLNHITTLTSCKSKSGQVNPQNRLTDPKTSFKRLPGSASNLNRRSAIESKATCIKLSREITREIVESTSQFEERPTWNTPYIAVGAMTLLSLDLLELSMHSSSSKLKNKRPAEYEIDVSNTNSVNRAKKHLKRCPNQNSMRSFEGSSEGNSLIHDQEDSSTWTEMSTTLETLTNEEIQATKEERRKELEQGLMVLERLSRWSPIAERGVILVRNLLGQKDPSNPVINAEKTFNLQRTCYRPGIFPTTSKSLTAPMTKIVARQDLKNTGQMHLFPSQVKQGIESRLINTNEGNRTLSPNNVSPLAHLPSILPPNVNSEDSFQFNQVAPPDVFQSPNDQQYHLGTAYQQIPTQDPRGINHSHASNATFNMSPNDEQSRSNLHSNFTSPQPISRSFKYTHQDSHLSESDFGQTSTTNLKPDYISSVPTNSTNLNQIRDPSPLQFINKSNPDPANHHTHQIDLANHHPPSYLPNSITSTSSSSTNLLQPCSISRSDEAHQNRNDFQSLNQNQSRKVWQNSEEIGVPYDYIESLLNSAFGQYAAPIDFDGIFLPS